MIKALSPVFDPRILFLRRTVKKAVMRVFLGVKNLNFVYRKTEERQFLIKE